MSTGSKTAVAASAPACRFSSSLAIFSARFKIAGSYAAASSIAVGKALANGVQHSKSVKRNEEEKCILMASNQPDHMAIGMGTHIYIYLACDRSAPHFRSSGLERGV